MMQMFKYPQGEGGHLCRRESAPPVAPSYLYSPSVHFSPLLSRFDLSTTRPQTLISLGGNGNGD